MRKANKFLVPLLAFFVSTILDIGVSWVGGKSITLASLAGITTFFFLTLAFFRFFRIQSRLYILCAILAGICVLQIPVRLAHLGESMGTLPVFISQLLGALAAWITILTHGWKKGAVMAVTILLGTWIYWRGVDLWLFKINYGTFTGQIQTNSPDHLEALDSQGHTVVLTPNGGNIVLLDFWFTHCGACFDEFPKVQQLYSRLNTRKDIAFYAVNRPIPSDTAGQAVQMIRDRKYTFPVLIMADKSMLTKLGIISFPTIIILDKNQKLIYRGDEEGAEKILLSL